MADRAKQQNDDLGERSVQQGFAVFTLSGHMKVEEVAELKALFDAAEPSFWTYET
jgi:hypothetical protein